MTVRRATPTSKPTTVPTGESLDSIEGATEQKPTQASTETSPKIETKTAPCAKNKSEKRKKRYFLKSCFRGFLLLCGLGVLVLGATSLIFFNQTLPGLTETAKPLADNKVELPIEMSFEERCKSISLGELDQVLVYGTNVTYCYPRRGNFKAYISEAVEQERATKQSRRMTQKNSHNFTRPTKTIFLLTSEVNNTDRRNVIREEWGSKGYVFFVMVLPGTQVEASTIAREMDQHGDIIWVDVLPGQGQGRGLKRRMASLHAIHTHLRSSDTESSSTASPFDMVFTSGDNTHVHVSLFQRHMAIVRPHYFGICVNVPKGSMNNVNIGFYPGDGEASLSGLRAKHWKDLSVDSFAIKVQNGRPSKVASTVGYAMSSSFVDCSLTKTAITKPPFASLHEDAMVAVLANRCGHKCMHSNLQLVRYEYNLVLQHRVKSSAEFYKLHQQYTVKASRKAKKWW